ncbi:hypothetical protein [Streptomyces sp. NPDC048639]|uniref:hypothetical protein n=1 Tax=Streptomyces sp. NPDC048639 TaxID=3365581 RepID=UPI003720178D
MDEKDLGRVVKRPCADPAGVGRAVPRIALSRLPQQPTVSSVIIGARPEERLRQNPSAVGRSLAPDRMAGLDPASHRPAP